jgi:FkbM family methyltransferase
VRLLYTYIRKFGFKQGIDIYRKLYSKKDGFVKISNFGEIYLRPKSSDVEVFNTVFVKEYYKSYSFDKMMKGFNPTFIIDAGANIGLSALFFAQKYKDSKVVAIEAEKGNFELLERNTKYFGSRIEGMHKALWFEKTELALKNPGADNYSFSFGNENGSETVETVTIPEIMEKYNVDRIGVLKIDIEGGEKELFSNDCSWLSKVDVLIIELHDFSTRGCSRAFYEQILKYQFSQMLNFENLIMINDSLVAHIKR